MIEKSPRVFGDFLGVCTPFAQTICIEKSVKMKPFMDKDFLLDTPTARHLYHDYCEALPICDYHCHLSPKEIYENAQPTDISALWLSGDHYKWRAMRSCGVDERYCTGDASPREKFQKFAYTLQYAIGNPLYHWAHIELQMYFGIDTPLSAATADDIYDRANAVMAAGDFRPRTLIEKSKVKVLCTTDDPADDLAYHKKIAALPDFDCKVLPTFRPDKALHIQAPDFADYMATLAAAAGMEIHTVDDVIAALRSRAEYFHSVGCRVSDQAFDVPPYAPAAPEQVQAVFAKALAGAPVTEQEAQIYKTPVHPLYNVNDVLNGIYIHGNVIGDVMFFGAGAGKLPTASAVVADVVDCVKHKGRNVMTLWSYEKLELGSAMEVERTFFVRIKDRAALEKAKEAFHAVQTVTVDGLDDEFGLVTANMTEQAFAQAAAQFDVAGRIRFDKTTI